MPTLFCRVATTGNTLLFKRSSLVVETAAVQSAAAGPVYSIADKSADNEPQKIFFGGILSEINELIALGPRPKQEHQAHGSS